MNTIKICLFCIRAQISLYQMNTDKLCIRVSLNQYFIKNIRQSNIFQPSKGRLQGAHLLCSSNVGQTN